MGSRAGAILIALALGAAACGSSQPPPRVAPPQADRTRALVWAVGDGADGSAVAKRLARRIARDRPTRFLYLGDVYDTGSAADFRNGYAPVYGRLASITMPTSGNHDWPLRREGYYPYWRSHRRGPIHPWYAFRVGGWLFLSLNSEAPHEPGSAQVVWLRRALKRHRGDCAIAYWHRPRWSGGLHGDQPDVAPLWGALRGHARIVLNGHDHDLQRFGARDGIVEYVAGGGGHGLYPVDANAPRLRFSDDSHYGGLRIALAPGAATLAFVSVDGAVLDRSRLTCRRR